MARIERKQKTQRTGIPDFKTIVSFMFGIDLAIRNTLLNALPLPKQYFHGLVRYKLALKTNLLLRISL